MAFRSLIGRLRLLALHHSPRQANKVVPAEVAPGRAQGKQPVAAFAARKISNILAISAHRGILFKILLLQQLSPDTQLLTRFEQAVV